MKSTGRINPFTGKEIMQIEEHDINFWHKDWNDLTDSQKVDYLSYRGIQILADANRATVEALYYSDSHKNR
jgi:hypothetical protein